jgi:integrase
MPKLLLNRKPTVADCLKSGAGRYNFGDSLYLAVRGSSAIWEYQFRAAGKLKSMCLGSAVARAPGDAPITLTAAREARAKAWLARKMGETATANSNSLQGAPVAAGKRFSQAAEDYLRDHRSEWAEKQHGDHERRLRLHALAKLGSKYCSRITVDDVANVLRPIWTGPNHGRGAKLRGLIETILNAQELPQPTVAAWSRLQHKLPKTDAETVNRASLDYAKLPALLAELAADDSTAARAIRFATLTGARQMEAVAAKWGEFDLEARVWEVPASRMKARVRHFVPLSDAALECLGEPGAPDDFVFKNDRGDGHLPHSLTGPKLAEFKRTNEDGAPITLHGMRATFATWAEDNGFAEKVIDLALAHKERDQVKAAYLRSEMHKPRKKLLDAWGIFATKANLRSARRAAGR